MRLSRHTVGVMVAIALLLGSLGGSVVLAQNSSPTASPTAVQAPAQQESGADDQVQEPSYTCSLTADQQASISAADAEAAALAANPGTPVVQTELDDENGCLVYSVELGNGTDVKVDAGNGAILYTEQNDDQAEVGEANEAGEVAEADNDNVQEEHESQADDVFETPGVEDAVGQ